MLDSNSSNENKRSNMPQQSVSSTSEIQSAPDENSDASEPFTTPASQSDNQSVKRFSRKILDIVLIIIVALALAYFVRAFVVTPYEIPSGSMLDTIQIEDKVMSERLSYYFGEPKQGDIVTFTDPDDPNRTLIKRVIATEGQTVDFIDGDVYVDGKKLDEPYLKEGSYTEPLLEHPEGMDFISYPFTVPEGHVWVMGDNRLESADSRYFGPVDVDTISGHAVFRYWPPSRLGAID